jgi:hypothetical protein
LIESLPKPRVSPVGLETAAPPAQLRTLFFPVHIRRNGHAHRKQWEDGYCANNGRYLHGRERRPADEIEVLQHSEQSDKNDGNECDYEKSAKQHGLTAEFVTLHFENFPLLG